MLAQGIETVERNANQLAGLIRDLLDLTRIISGKIELAREPADLSSLVQSAFAESLSTAEELRIKMELSLPTDPIVSDVDPVRIQQVMSNLLSNALKFTPAEGWVWVTLRRDESLAPCAVIEVADSGIGIETDFLPHIFERFTQAHGGINRRYDGLGSRACDHASDCRNARRASDCRKRRHRARQSLHRQAANYKQRERGQ